MRCPHSKNHWTFTGRIHRVRTVQNRSEAFKVVPILKQCITYIVMIPYTVKRRDVLGNKSPEDQEISFGGDFGPWGPRVPRGAKSLLWDVLPNTYRLETVYIQEVMRFPSHLWIKSVWEVHLQPRTTSRASLFQFFCRCSTPVSNVTHGLKIRILWFQGLASLRPAGPRWIVRSVKFPRVNFSCLASQVWGNLIQH